MNSITVKELKDELARDGGGKILLDVREPFEHKSTKIPDSENIPLDSVRDAVDRLKEFGTVYVHCVSGGRSARACQLLEEKGVNVVNVEGGINAWKKQGFEVLGSGKEAIPLMRQVMIAAGSLSLIGVALGIFAHPGWYGLSALVGAGLLFAGVTGICSMTYVLKRMPWNKA